MEIENVLKPKINMKIQKLDNLNISKCIVSELHSSLLCRSRDCVDHVTV